MPKLAVPNWVDLVDYTLDLKWIIIIQACYRQFFPRIPVVLEISLWCRKLTGRFGSRGGGGGSSIVKVPGDVPPTRVNFFGPLV